MADKKISQLTGASTPLAGTEVLPIVQSGSTVKVAVSNLTAGRSVSAGSVDSAGDVSVGTSNAGLTQLVLTTTGEAADQKNWRFQTGTGIGTGVLRLRAINDAGSSGQNAWIVSRTAENIDSQNFLTGGSNRLSIGATDVTVNTGNLVVGTAGKGVADSSGVARVSIASGSTVINESGADLDFRVEGVSDTDALVVDASTGRTGFGTNSPDAKVQVLSTAAIPSYKISGNSNSQGTAQKITVVRQYPVVSLGTKLIIPFFNQGVLNSTTICKVWGHGARYNTRESLGFEITFCVGNVSTTLDNLVSWGGNGNYSSIAVNGNNIEITFTTAYTSATADGIFATIEFMCNDHTLTVDVANIAMN